MMMRHLRGQSMLEYIIILTVVIAALLTMQIYIKRGLAGRWKQSVDDVGDQYDPRLTSGIVRHAILSTSNTIITSTFGNLAGVNGYYTMRTDHSSATESKTGRIEIGN